MTSPSARGRFVAFEGIDASGKSTQAPLLGRLFGPDTLVTREPGSTRLGARLRELLLDRAGPPISPRAEVLLMLADRADHVDGEILPALAAGRDVVCDRFSGSTLAYQGYGRALDVDALRAMTTWAAAELEPDLTILLDLDPALSADRLGGLAPDRFEMSDGTFFDRVRQGYVALAAQSPDSWTVVDASLSEEDVSARVESAVRQRWPTLRAIPSPR